MAIAVEALPRATVSLPVEAFLKFISEDPSVSARERFVWRRYLARFARRA